MEQTKIPTPSLFQRYKGTFCLWLSGIAASLASFSNGVAIAYTSPVLPQLLHENILTPHGKWCLCVSVCVCVGVCVFSVSLSFCVTVHLYLSASFSLSVFQCRLSFCQRFFVCLSVNLSDVLSICARLQVSVSVYVVLTVCMSVSPYIITLSPSSSSAGSWFASLMPLGAILGTLVAGFLIDFLGRKTSLLLMTLPFSLGWLSILIPAPMAATHVR